MELPVAQESSKVQMGFVWARIAERRCRERFVQTQSTRRRERTYRTIANDAESRCLHDERGKSMLAQAKRMLCLCLRQPYNIKVPARWPPLTSRAPTQYAAKNAQWRAIPSSPPWELPRSRFSSESQPAAWDSSQRRPILGLT